MSRLAVFTISLSEPAQSRVSISYRTVNLTAVSPDDFTEIEGSITFEIGEMTKVISIPVRDAMIGTPAKCFAVTLYNSKGCEIGRADGNIEILRATDRQGDLITVQRGVEGTQPRAFIAGDAIELRMTAAAIKDLQNGGGTPQNVSVSISDGQLG